MKRFIMVVSLVFASFGMAGSAYAQATQVDALIKKLVEKGILDKTEARELKAEIAADEKIVREETKNQILPEWVQKIKLKGDLRTRYQYERRKNDSESRGRARIRYRLGIEANPAKDVKVGAGLASGNADPRSTNQTLENSFETPDIRLDYAFGEWKAAESAKIIAGKFDKKDYLWTTTDMIWDTDIMPNGMATNYTHKVNDSWKAFGNAGWLMIDEFNRVDNKDDIFMSYYQTGVGYNQGMMDAIVTGVKYAFHNTKGKCPNWTAGTNTGVTAGSDGVCTGTLTYNYNSYGTSAEVGLKKPFGGLPFGIDGRIALFGDYIYNPDPEAENHGWAFGGKFGTEKLSAPGDWQVKYTKVVLERDAFVDFTPDSDRYGGGTNKEGHEVELNYVWKENVILGLDYYKTNNLTGSRNQEQIVQGDVVFKF